MEHGVFPNSRLLVRFVIEPASPNLKHPQTGPRVLLAGPGLRNNRVTLAAKPSPPMLRSWQCLCSPRWYLL